MTSHPHLSKAPITEAIIDIRVAPLQGTVLESLKEPPAAEYALRHQNMGFSSQVHVTDGGAASVSASAPQIFGYTFRSSEQPYVAQARLDGFSLSRLAPYEKWEKFRDEAKHVWGWYREAVGSQLEITRLAVRYLNRIELPLPIADLGDYFKTRPEVCEDLPHHDMSALLMVIQVPQPDIKAVLNLRQASLPPEVDKENVVSIVIDIDLFRTSDLPQSENGIWNYFEDLSKRKDDIFFSCITPTTTELLR